MTPESTPARLSVPGANLYYEVRGSGPALLILPGGDGDAASTSGIADSLAADYTVITYDRRGLSRSTVESGSPPIDVGTHADDAHRLLLEVAQDPALVLGSSIGAVLGLEVICRHPEQVRLLVAHEAPATQFLPNAEREAASRSQLEVESAFRTEGIAAAMRGFAVMAGLDLNDREPDVVLPAPTPQRAANLTFFLTHDAPAVRLHRFDGPRLQAHAGKIVVGQGTNPTARMPGRCAVGLASFLGVEATGFPGGHNGLTTHPKAFVARLRVVLSGARTPPG